MIDERKLLECMDERYKEVKDMVIDSLAQGFYQMEKLIKEQPKVDKWIPCSERLPDHNCALLVQRGDGIMTRGFYLDYEDDEKPFWNTDCDEDYGESKVIAWCELPEPYKGD